MKVIICEVKFKELVMMKLFLSGFYEERDILRVYGWCDIRGWINIIVVVMFMFLSMVIFGLIVSGLE